MSELPKFNAVMTLRHILGIHEFASRRMNRSIRFIQDKESLDIIVADKDDKIELNSIFSPESFRALMLNQDILCLLIVNRLFQKLGVILIGYNLQKELCVTVFSLLPHGSDLAKVAGERILSFIENEIEISKALLLTSDNNLTVHDKNQEKPSNKITGFEFLEKYLDGFEGTQIEIEEILFENQVRTTNNILTAGPSISPLEISYVSDAVENGWNLHHSDYLGRFENEFAEFIGSSYALATSSCTGALHLALLAMGIGNGDEVLVPDITWVATASAVMYVGAKPIFIDIDPDTWTIDLKNAEEKITDKTKAIIPVHLYGYAVNMRAVMDLATKYSLRVIEDAAPAIGTRINGKMAGSFGDFGCFSFQGAKLLVTGEGGMLVTNSKDLYDRARKIQDHGRRPGTFWIEELGYKYKMNNITAALGLGQIQRAENQIFRKRRINKWYMDELATIGGIRFQQEAADTKSICWMTSFTLDETINCSRDKLIALLKENNIDSRPVFPSISQYKIWGYSPTVPKVSKSIGDNGINLPSGVLLNKKTVEYICNKIKAILEIY